MRHGTWEHRFRWLWAAYTISTVGTWLAFDAFPIIAVIALHVSALQVSLLAAAGVGVSAVVSVPLGSWVERHHKRRVMIGMDLARFAGLATVPVAYAGGWLRFGQLLAVAVVVGVADICFRAASGSYLKALVPRDRLLVANARFEATTWTATMVGPPLGGALIGAFGPVVTVLTDAVTYLLSALGVRAAAGADTPPAPSRRLARGDLFAGWQYLLGERSLRALLANTALVNALIMATAPLMAVLMLGELHVAPWQYGLAFAAPCAGGFAGARLARRLVARHGVPVVLRRAGALRACWSLALAGTPGGWAGVCFVAVVQLGLVTCCGLFNPVAATYRLEHTPDDRLARTLAAWTITTKLAVASLTLLLGLVAALVGVRAAVAIAGAALLVTPALLPSRRRLEQAEVDRDRPAAFAAV